MSQQNLNKIYGNVLVAETLNAATTLDKFDTGKVFILTQEGGVGYTVTLPSPDDAGEGWNCKFIVQDASVDYTITTDGFGLLGHIATTDGGVGASAVDPGAPATDLDSVSGQSAVGDTFTILCQGTLFVVQGTMSGSGGATLTAP